MNRRILEVVLVLAACQLLTCGGVSLFGLVVMGLGVYDPVVDDHLPERMRLILPWHFALVAALSLLGWGFLLWGHGRSPAQLPPSSPLIQRVVLACSGLQCLEYVVFVLGNLFLF